MILDQMAKAERQRRAQGIQAWRGKATRNVVEAAPEDPSRPDGPTEKVLAGMVAY
jgi:hypothetical protein